ncbi:aurora kinase C-like [Haliotis rufescens]|uniref:aurora kinase C-like n=1 Tax=Haliotis rufescens TaxID=6454 RepID=UPI00201F7872|nr:aurora kinase C-like [Haliotis rufescens]
MASLLHLKTFSNCSMNLAFASSSASISGPHNAAAELWREHLQTSDTARTSATPNTTYNTRGSAADIGTSTGAGSQPTAPTDPPTLVGQTINGYYFEGVIELGGCARVYRVRKDGVLYAAKVSLHTATDDSFAVRTWVNEYAVLRSIDHENIIKAYDLFRYNMKMFMIMEYFEGYDMVYFISKFSVKWRQENLKPIAKQIMAGLNHLHNNNIVHRDIKPENILIGSGNEVKIIDFGGAIRLEQQQTPEDRHVTCSTSYFAPPEMHRGDVRATSNAWIKSFDMWSTGVTLYTALAGQYPFPLGSDRKITSSVFDQGPDFGVLGQIDTKLLSLMKRCLDTNPERRITAKRAMHHRYFWRGALDVISYALFQCFGK